MQAQFRCLTNCLICLLTESLCSVSIYVCCLQCDWHEIIILLSHSPVSRSRLSCRHKCVWSPLDQTEDWTHSQTTSTVVVTHTPLYYADTTHLSKVVLVLCNNLSTFHHVLTRTKCYTLLILTTTHASNSGIKLDRNLYPTYIRIQPMLRVATGHPDTCWIVVSLNA